jgi:hypothetical protein
MRYRDYQRVSVSEVLLVLALFVLASIFWVRGFATLTQSTDTESACKSAQIWAQDFNVHDARIECAPEDNGWARCELQGANFEGSLHIDCNAVECVERFSR